MMAFNPERRAPGRMPVPRRYALPRASCAPRRGSRYPRFPLVPLLPLLPLVPLVTWLAACAVSRPQSARRDHAPPRRAIVVSFDAFNERRITDTVDPARIPAIRALFGAGSCAVSVQPAFPSVTAAGHAAVWTGGFGNVSGIAANSHLRLPSAAHSILETLNGFSVAGLRAEPLWISAAATGMTVFAHHVTQAPGPPGYPVDDGEPPDTFRVARARAREALASSRLSVLNGYNRVLMAPRVVTQRDVRLAAATGWRGVSADGAARALEFSLPLSGDSLVRGDTLHILVRVWLAGDSAQLYAGFARDLSRAVRVMPHAEERAPARGRTLARFFSDAAVIPLRDGRRASMRLRLFTLTARDTAFTLFVPGMQLAEANRSALTSAYDEAVPGWVGNSAAALWESGAFGRTMLRGGDGTAEWRWMESAELLARGFMEGAAWGWRTSQPRLMLDYFPLGDDTDHALWGLLDARWPGYDAARAGRVRAVRDRLWELTDLRLGALMQLARASPGTRLFVTGDHGMRATWRRFRPNVALQQAGLLALDGAGRIDLSRTRAASANGYWISVNRRGRRGGIVAEGQVGEVMDEVRRALLAVRDEWGRAVVTQVIDRRDAGAAALGIGGAAGGDVYYEVAEGYRWTWEPQGPVVDDAPAVLGSHGFPSTSPDMHTVFCQWWPDARGAPRAVGARLTDVAPAVKSWMGIP